MKSLLLLAGAAVYAQEITPGLMLAQRLELDDKVVEIGSSREDVVEALGPKAKSWKKKRTASQLASEYRLMLSLGLLLRRKWFDSYSAVLPVAATAACARF